jgi:hypothetical protein
LGGLISWPNIFGPEILGHAISIDTFNHIRLLCAIPEGVFSLLFRIGSEIKNNGATDQRSWLRCMPDIAFSGRRKRYDTMPEYVQEQTKPTNGNPQQDQQTKQQPSQPLQVQPDGTWILGRGADRWMPTKNQIGDLRWVVERDLRQELDVPPK